MRYDPANNNILMTPNPYNYNSYGSIKNSEFYWSTLISVGSCVISTVRWMYVLFDMTANRANLGFLSAALERAGAQHFCFLDSWTIIRNLVHFSFCFVLVFI